MKAHVCPKCDGKKVIVEMRNVGASHGEVSQAVECPTCSGSGVVWESEAKDAVQVKQGIMSSETLTRSNASASVKEG